LPEGTRYELRQRVGVAGGPRRCSREKGLSRECSEAPRQVRGVRTKCSVDPSSDKTPAL
jgi:hypothetical protein